MRLINSGLLALCLLSNVAAQNSTAKLNPFKSAISATQKSVPQTSASSVFKVPFEKFTLKNGLQVIFHVDRSDPVVAVALTAHVGSAREKE